MLINKSTKRRKYYIKTETQGSKTVCFVRFNSEPSPQGTKNDKHSEKHR